MILTVHWSVVYVLKVIDVLLDLTTLYLVLKELIKIRLVRAFVFHVLQVNTVINSQSQTQKSQQEIVQLVIIVLDQLELKNRSKHLKMENYALLNSTVQQEQRLNFLVQQDTMMIERDFLNASFVQKDISVLEVLLNLKFVLLLCIVQLELQQELSVQMELTTLKTH